MLSTGPILLRGEFVVVPAFVAVWVMTTLKLPFPPVYLIILIFMGVFGIVFQRLADYPLRNRTFLPVVISTIGVSIFLNNAAQLVFGVQHRLIPPRTPRLNGKVERSHQTDEEEFYRLHRYSTQQDLRKAFARCLWQYNPTRFHMALKGETPIQTLRLFQGYAQIKQLRCYPC